VNTQTQTPQLNKKIKSLFIEGRLWFDKINGNTYHAVKIEANGQIIKYLPMSYGYGDQYLQTALTWLKTYGLVSEETNHIRELREYADIYLVSYHTPKRELWKAQSVEESYTKLLFIEELKKAGAN
jgi:hypothetical protein